MAFVATTNIHARNLWGARGLRAQSVWDKRVESAAGKAHKADLRQYIAHLKPISATRLITGFLLEAFMAFTIAPGQILSQNQTASQFGS